MRKVLRNPPKKSGRGKLPSVPKKAEDTAAWPSPRHEPQTAAIDKLLNGASARREGKRILMLGATRKGKTTFARKLLAGLLRSRVAGVMLVHDQKHPDHQQFSGPSASTVNEIRDLVVKGETQIVCRAPITVEEAAQIVRDLVESGVPAGLMIDEVTPALRVNQDTLEPMERVWCGSSPVWILLQGGGLGATLVLNAQMPKAVPGTMVDSAEAYIVFNLGGRSLEYSVDLHLIPRAAVPTVLALNEGEFCLFRADQEWDRIVYGPS